MSSKSLYFCLALLMFFSACSSDKIFEKHKRFPDNNWSRHESLRFDVNIPDKGSYDIYVAIRHASHYPFANVNIGLTIETPSGTERFMKHQLMVRHEDGSFKGDGLGDIWDNQIMVFENYLLSEAGTYVFTVENLMHLVELRGIMAVGIVVKRSK